MRLGLLFAKSQGQLRRFDQDGDCLEVEDKNNRIKLQGLVCVFLSAVFFSLAGILIKLISWSPMTINGIRSIFAALVMLVYIKKIGHRFVLNKTVFFGALCNTVMNGTFVIATKITSAANAIVLQFTMPIFIIVFTMIFFKKRPKTSETVTCLIVFSGIVCFFFDSLTRAGMLGNILAIVSGAAYAGVFMQKRIPGSDFESSAVIGQLLSVVISIPFWFQESTFTFTDAWAIVVLGVVQMGFAYILLAKGLEHVSPITASITSTIEPILNPAIVALFYGESMGMFSKLGAGIVICSVAVYNILNAKNKVGNVANV